MYMELERIFDYKTATNDLPVLHSIVRKTGCSDPVVYVEGRRWKMAAVSLAEVSCHEQNVATKLDKVLVTATQLHLLRTEISNKEISVCDV